MIQYLEKKLHLNIQYADTDSIFVSVESPMRNLCAAKNVDYDSLDYDEKRKYMQLISDKIESTIRAGYDELHENLNVIDPTFSMKRELFGDKGIWLGKKMYCIKVIDKEGVPQSRSDKPYVRGFDIAKKSANPKWVIDRLTEYLELVFDGNREEVVKFEKEKQKQFASLSPDDKFFIRSVSSFNNYKNVDSKGAQAHTKGAIIYNSVVRKHNMSSVCPLVFEGDRVRFCYVKEPNSLNTNAIAYNSSADGDMFVDFLKKEYGIELDDNKQWETIFLKPARRLTAALSWDMSGIGKFSFSKFFKG